MESVVGTCFYLPVQCRVQPGASVDYCLHVSAIACPVGLDFMECKETLDDFCYGGFGNAFIRLCHIREGLSAVLILFPFWFGCSGLVFQDPNLERSVRVVSVPLVSSEQETTRISAWKNATVSFLVCRTDVQVQVSRVKMRLFLCPQTAKDHSGSPNS